MLTQSFAKKNLSNRLDSINVMVIDGRSKTGNLIKCILNRLGFRNVFVANTIAVGVQIIREKKINIVFTEWDLSVLIRPAANAPKTESTVSPENLSPEVMPISGAQFVERLRSSPSSPNPFLPVVMMLRSDSSEECKLARDAGANEIVMKPFSAADLCQRIVSIIDAPRIFIHSGSYKGPCRRISKLDPPKEIPERRMREIRFFQPSASRR